MNKDTLKLILAVRAAKDPENHSDEARLALVAFGVEGQPILKALELAEERLLRSVNERLKEVYLECNAAPTLRPRDWEAAYYALETIAEFMAEIPEGALPTIEAAKKNIERQFEEFFKDEDVLETPFGCAIEHAAALDPRWVPLEAEFSEIYESGII